ncbi:GNAT family N-acetyltransferase [Streptomyces jumonjinensis]|uniref:GNAT family N-acetyltransferase n=1 Tax=Streptomyces jumonjinensis TaxID=1945 RepID=A0A646KUI9_STRJU|nr:GNAT family N-acetyltransferase [Streptomyces jumonjinensis]MQT04666.1 GNAT family N-acetyltransferase [Streptomyces jumonjinensis]
MSLAITPVIPAGSLSAAAQPSLPSADGELLLRPWAPGDETVLLAAYRDALIGRWHMRRVDSPEEARKWIATCGRQWREESGAQWAVTRASGGEILGRMALRWIDLAQGLAECGYWILPAARRQGVAHRALITLSGWALDEAGFHRLELAHSHLNEASCRVAVKAGFPLEGVRRSAHLHRDGWHDMHQHARIQGDA